MDRRRTDYWPGRRNIAALVDLAPSGNLIETRQENALAPDRTRAASIRDRAECSERLDLDFAEFNDALVVRYAARVLHTEAVLDGNLSVCKLGVLRAVDGLLAVEHNSERRTLCRDLEGVPFASRVRHRIDLGDVDD